MPDDPFGSPSANGEGEGSTIADRAEEPQQEEFPLGMFEPEDRKTLKTLIRAGLPVEMTVSMMAAEIPLRGGIPDPEKQHRFLTTTEFHRCIPTAVREEGKLTGWKIRAQMRPEYVEAVPHDRTAIVERLLALSPSRFAEVVERLDEVINETAVEA